MNIDGLRQEAESGNIVAQAILGACYFDGVFVDVDYDEAFRLLSAAGAQGVPRAKAYLGRMYAKGLGVDKDISEGVRLLESAAIAGEFLAQIDLARLFSSGTEMPHDPEAARKWYSAAIAQASIEECDELREAREYLRRGRPHTSTERGANTR